MEDKDKNKADFVSRKEKLMKEIAEKEYRIQGETHYPSLIITQLIVASLFFGVFYSFGDRGLVDWLGFGGLILFQVWITSICID